MARKTTVDTSRFKPIKGDKARRYVDVASGTIISRRQATQKSLPAGMTLEKRAKENKQNRASATKITEKTRLPRRSKVKNSSGKDTGWTKIKAHTLAEVVEYAGILPPNTIMMVLAYGRITPNDSPDILKDGKVSVRLQWRVISKTMFRADEINKQLIKLSTRAQELFVDIKHYEIHYKQG